MCVEHVETTTPGKWKKKLLKENFHKVIIVEHLYMYILQNIQYNINILVQLSVFLFSESSVVR